MPDTLINMVSGIFIILLELQVIITITVYQAI